MKILVSLVIFISIINADILKHFTSYQTLDYIKKYNSDRRADIIDYHNRFKIKYNNFSVFGNLGIIQYNNNKKSHAAKELHSSLYFDYLYSKIKINNTLSITAGIIPILGGQIEKFKNYDIPRGNGLGILGKYNTLGFDFIFTLNENNKIKIGYGKYFGKDISNSHYFLKSFKGSQGVICLFEHKQGKHYFEFDYNRFSVDYTPYFKNKKTNLYGIGYVFDNSIKDNFALYGALGYSEFLDLEGYAYKAGMKFYFDLDTFPIEYNIGTGIIKTNRDFYNLDNTLFKYYQMNNHGKSEKIDIYTNISYKNKFILTPMYTFFTHDKFPKDLNIFTLKFRYKF